MKRGIHVFDNKVKVYKHHLLDIQKERYKDFNVHEAEEEVIFLNLIKKLKYGGSFVNLGAAIGYYVLLAKLIRPDIEVCCYEPLRLHRKFLNENIALNRLKKTDIKIYKEGVSICSGHAKFKLNSFSSMISTNILNRSLFNLLEGVFTNKVIKTIPLQEVWNRVGKEIDLLQMDIQGLEFELLNSSKNLLKQKVIKNFLIGTHSKSIHDACNNLLSSYGYQIVFNLHETKLQPDGILVAEAI